MGFKDFLNGAAKIIASRNQGKEDLPDDVTTDKYLRSLRRQRRVQMEEIEKKQLIQRIKAFEKRRMQKELIGFKRSLPKKKIIPRSKKKSDYGFFGRGQI